MELEFLPRLSGSGVYPLSHGASQCERIIKFRIIGDGGNVWLYNNWFFSQFKISL